MPESAAPAPPPSDAEAGESRILSAKEMESLERANIERALAGVRRKNLRRKRRGRAPGSCGVDAEFPDEGFGRPSRWQERLRVCSRREKRQRAAAVHDATATRRKLPNARSVLDCASLLALFHQLPASTNPDPDQSRPESEGDPF